MQQRILAPLQENLFLTPAETLPYQAWQQIVQFAQPTAYRHTDLLPSLLEPASKKVKQFPKSREWLFLNDGEDLLL
jgi:hypothetical protein